MARTMSRQEMHDLARQMTRQMANSIQMGGVSNAFTPPKPKNNKQNMAFSIEGIDISNLEENLNQFELAEVSSIGDIRRLPDLHHHNVRNPFLVIKSESSNFRVGEVVFLNSNDGSSSPYFCKVSDSNYTQCVSWHEVKLIVGMSTKKMIPKKVDMKYFDKLVIAEDVKEEILAVMKQFEHNDKIFKEWGLDEVIEYGKGMTFLFYGGPGTGKTWAANCMAKALGKDLLIVAAADIQTSEPGGANRNIQQAFQSAKSGKKVLLLDECDSLITSRNDVGMILGSEINTLLTEIEKFEGVVILTTNRVETLDEALERRIALIVEFPDPNLEARKMLWTKMIPKKMPLGKGVNTDALAEQKLTGGQIKNAVLQAARLAVASESKKVELAHFDSAIARIHKSRSLLGTASRFRQIKVMDDYTKDRSK